LEVLEADFVSEAVARGGIETTMYSRSLSIFRDAEKQFVHSLLSWHWRQPVVAAGEVCAFSLLLLVEEH